MGNQHTLKFLYDLQRLPSASDHLADILHHLHIMQFLIFTDQLREYFISLNILMQRLLVFFLLSLIYFPLYLVPITLESFQTQFHSPPSSPSPIMEI